MASIGWTFEASEISSVEEIVTEFESNPFVVRRIEQNIEQPPPDVSRHRIWSAHLVAQLTSQQRSGPESVVTKFLNEQIDALSLQRCREAEDVQEFVTETLSDFGGFRFYNKIGEACKKNLQLLEQNERQGWGKLERELQQLQKVRQRAPKPGDAEREREVCHYVYEELGGTGLHRIGPKQSRNLLQILGLTRYETPLDSRITRWLNENLKLPYRLSAGGLSEPAFYDFHMDLVQAICEETDIVPCVFDAAVFTSYSPDWSGETVENVLL